MLYFKVYDEITWRYTEPYVPTDANALVLDGRGVTGRWAVRTVRKECKVILMDIPEGMLEIAAERVKEDSLQHKITIKEADITKTGYVDETFDMIFC